MSILQIKRLQQKYPINKSLLKNFIRWLGIDETVKLLEMKPDDIKKTVRVNLLKITIDDVILRLKKEGIIAKKMDEIYEGLHITNNWNKVGSSQSYLNGEIMPQGLGSMLTVHALDPQPGEKILDMAAAPGGKTCFIGERMKNTGILVANDKSKSRLSSLISNLSRHSIDNVIITNRDASNIKDGDFDKILLDAPCTGEGLIVSHPNRKTSKSIVNNYDMQKIQIILIKRAISLLKIGGVCVYSTCSLSPIENEEVVHSVLNHVKIEQIHIAGDPGKSELHPDFYMSKRILPSKMYCDGFFIVRLRRVK